MAARVRWNINIWIALCIQRLERNVHTDVKRIVLNLFTQHKKEANLYQIWKCIIITIVVVGNFVSCETIHNLALLIIPHMTTSYGTQFMKRVQMVFQKLYLGLWSFTRLLTYRITPKANDIKGLFAWGLTSKILNVLISCQEVFSVVEKLKVVCADLVIGTCL